MPPHRTLAVAASRAAGYGIAGVTVAGTDIPAAYAACREAVDRARRGEGPTLIDAKVWRMNSHTSEDNHLKYRTKEEIADASEHDPITRFVALLEEHRWITTEAAAKVQDDYNPQNTPPTEARAPAAPPQEPPPGWARPVRVAPPVTDTGPRAAAAPTAEDARLRALPMQKNPAPEWSKTAPPAEPAQATDPKE